MATYSSSAMAGTQQPRRGWPTLSNILVGPRDGCTNAGAHMCGDEADPMSTTIGGGGPATSLNRPYPAARRMTVPSIPTQQIQPSTMPMSQRPGMLPQRPLSDTHADPYNSNARPRYAPSTMPQPQMGNKPFNQPGCNQPLQQPFSSAARPPLVAPPPVHTRPLSTRRASHPAPDIPTNQTTAVPTLPTSSTTPNRSHNRPGGSEVGVNTSVSAAVASRQSRNPVKSDGLSKFDAVPSTQPILQNIPNLPRQPSAARRPLFTQSESDAPSSDRGMSRALTQSKGKDDAAPRSSSSDVGTQVTPTLTAQKGDAKNRISVPVAHPQTVQSRKNIFNDKRPSIRPHSGVLSHPAVAPPVARTGGLPERPNSTFFKPMPPIAQTF